MLQNALPGRQQPYFLESGEGRPYRLGPFLATTIGHREDTGSLMEGVVLIGARNSSVPLHRHNRSHEAIYVLEGSAGLRLGDKEFALMGGDYASVPPGVDVEFLPDESSAITPGEKSSVPPAGVEPYVIPAGEGERMMAGDQLFTFLTGRRQSGGNFLALMTEGPKGHRIPNHVHFKHTETFFCLNGSVSMTAGEEQLSLYPGDFLHLPAGTPPYR